MILDAIGAEQIRDAFSTAASSVSDTVEEVTDLAGTLSAAAEQYENQAMAASTVTHLRDAAASADAARASLDTAEEKLQAALGDFDAHDGRVAEAVDGAGNLMLREGYGEAFSTPAAGPPGPVTAAAAPAAPAAPAVPELSPAELVDGLQDLQDGYRWLSMSEGNPSWRPSVPTPELAAQLTADDKAEDDGMHGDDRQTCGTHRSWLADCINDPSHSNPGTRDRPGSSYNWCTAHRAPVQVCRCWPATVDGTPPALAPAAS